MMEGVSAFPERPVRVSTLELFFDLVFVFTITQLTGVLVDGGDVAAIADVVVMFAVIWWMYDGYALADEHDRHGSAALSPPVDRRNGRLPRYRPCRPGCV
jgi:hypothetical protein